ncbi:MAG: carbohydrate ABC transporter permease, partial [Caldilinea sp.]
MKTSSFRKIMGWVGLYGLWTFMAIVTIIPIYWMVVVSARSRVQLFDAPTLLITSFYAPNYIKPLTDPVFQRYLVNSLIVATSNALLVTVLALLATYALSRWRL